jgi:hypothetical protein
MVRNPTVAFPKAPDPRTLRTSSASPCCGCAVAQSLMTRSWHIGTAASPPVRIIGIDPMGAELDRDRNGSMQRERSPEITGPACIRLHGAGAIFQQKTSGPRSRQRSSGNSCAQRLTAGMWLSRYGLALRAALSAILSPSRPQSLAQSCLAAFAGSVIKIS